MLNLKQSRTQRFHNPDRNGISACALAKTHEVVTKDHVARRSVDDPELRSQLGTD